MINLNAASPTAHLSRPGASPTPHPDRPSASRGVHCPDVGSASLFLVISMLGLLVLVGLVVDGGVKVRAIARADALAAEAARAAGQAINTPAAQAFLRTNHVTGTATVVDGGDVVRVQVRISAPTVFLGMIGIHRMHVSGQATADLVSTGDPQALDTRGPDIGAPGALGAPTPDAWALARLTTDPVSGTAGLAQRRDLR